MEQYEIPEWFWIINNISDETGARTCVACKWMKDNKPVCAKMIYATKIARQNVFCCARCGFDAYDRSYQARVLVWYFFFAEDGTLFHILAHTCSHSLWQMLCSLQLYLQRTYCTCISLKLLHRASSKYLQWSGESGSTEYPSLTTCT